MPFLAACAFCGRESHVPDCARDTSTRCPNCLRVGTLTPKPTASSRRQSAPCLIACSSCGQQTHIPQHVLGTSIRCPRCFICYPAGRKKRRTDQAVPSLVPAGIGESPGDIWWVNPGDLPRTYVRQTPPPPDPWWTNPLEPLPQVPVPQVSAPETFCAETLAEPQTLPKQAPKAAPVPPERAKPPAPWRPPKRDEYEDDPPRAIDPLGAGALFLACAALLCASVRLLCGLLVPLSCAALLAGLVALVRAYRWGQSRLTFPGAGSAVAGAVLFLGLACPAILGPTYRGFLEQNATDPTAIRRVTLAGKVADDADEDPEWPDARRTILQQGLVTVQVNEVAVAPVHSAAAPNKNGKAEVCLAVRLHIRQLPQVGTSAGRARGDAAILKEKHRPTIADTTGKVYELLDVQTGGSAEKTRRLSTFGLSSRVLIFEAPAPGVRALRLEIPAAAWGGRGAFRFEIPGAMIRRKEAAK